MKIEEYQSEVIAQGMKAFSEHETELQKLGSRIEVLDFRKPGSCWCALRMVFDDERGGRVYISGDLGEAVVYPTCPATLKAMAMCFTSRNEKTGELRVNTEYFLEKVRCSSDRYEWSHELFREDFNERCREREIILPEDYLEEHFDSYFADIEVDDRRGVRISGEAKDELEEQDHDYWEWLYDCGKRVSLRVILWLVAMRLAWEKVEKNESEVTK